MHHPAHIKRHTLRGGNKMADVLHMVTLLLPPPQVANMLAADAACWPLVAHIYLFSFFRFLSCVMVPEHNKKGVRRLDKKDGS